MPTVTLKASDFSGDGKEFGPFSPSSFATIRQRLNMNAVRLPVSAALYEESKDYRALVEQAVRQANRFELLAILAPDTEDDIRFWTNCAAQFKANPNLFFAPAGHKPQALVDAIRYPARISRSSSMALFAMPTPLTSLLRVTPTSAPARSDGASWGPSRSSLLCW